LSSRVSDKIPEKSINTHSFTSQYFENKQFINDLKSLYLYIVTFFTIKSAFSIKKTSEL